MNKLNVLDIYESIAPAYSNFVDTSPFNALYERPAMLKLIGDVKEFHILDAGCGNGYYIEILLLNGASSVIGIDFSSKMVELSKTRVGSKAKVLQADLNHPLCFLKGELFDLIICPLVLHYIENWFSLFVEFNSFLTIGGNLIFSTSHPMASFKSSTSQNYFEVEIIQEKWPSFNIEMPTYRKSFNSIFETMKNTGFVVETLLEPLPLPELRDINTEMYKRLSSEPYFLCIKARKERDIK